MSWSVVRKRELACPPERAWDLVSDLALTPSLNPMIRSVDVTGPDGGLGARRRCHAAGPGHLDEEIVTRDLPHSHRSERNFDAMLDGLVEHVVVGS